LLTAAALAFWGCSFLDAPGAKVIGIAAADTNERRKAFTLLTLRKLALVIGTGKWMILYYAPAWRSIKVV
jgi:hypothetical protein